MDPTLLNAVLPSLLSGLIALLAFGLAWWGYPGQPTDAGITPSRASCPRRWLGPMALTAVALGGYLLVNSTAAHTSTSAITWPTLWPGPQFLSLWPTIALLACTLGLASSAFNPPAPTRLFLRPLAYAAITAWAARNQIRNADIGTTITLLLGAGFYTHLLCTLLEHAARQQRGPVAPLVAMLIAAGTSIILIAGFAAQSPAFQIATLSAAMAGAAIVAFVRPRLTIAHGTMTTLGILVSAALIQATMFGQGSGPWQVLYLLAVLTAAAMPMLLEMASLPTKLLARSWLPGTIKVLATAAALAVGIGSAVVSAVGG